MGYRTGSNTNGLEVSPARARRYARKLRREEAEWRAKSGPVTVRRVDPATLRKPAK